MFDDNSCPCSNLGGLFERNIEGSNSKPRLAGPAETRWAKLAVAFYHRRAESARAEEVG